VRKILDQARADVARQISDFNFLGLVRGRAHKITMVAFAMHFKSRSGMLVRQPDNSPMLGMSASESLMYRQENPAALKEDFEALGRKDDRV
jgi:hypothetical protein